MSFKQESIEITSSVMGYEILLQLVSLAKRLLVIGGEHEINRIAEKSGYLDKYHTVNKVTLANHATEHYKLIVSVTGEDKIEGGDVTGNVYITYKFSPDGFVLDY